MTGRTRMRTRTRLTFLISVFALMVLKGDITFITTEFGKGMHDRSMYHFHR